MPHTVSAILGIVCALLVAVAIGVLYGYLPSASVGGLTAGGMGWLAGVAFVAAGGAYFVEESSGGRRYSVGGAGGAGSRPRRR
jgi:hypothetical protein